MKKVQFVVAAIVALGSSGIASAGTTPAEDRQAALADLQSKAGDISALLGDDFRPVSLSLKIMVCDDVAGVLADANQALGTSPDSDLADKLRTVKAAASTTLGDCDSDSVSEDQIYGEAQNVADTAARAL